MAVGVALDLSVLATVRELAATLPSVAPQIHAIFCNAGYDGHSGTDTRWAYLPSYCSLPAPAEACQDLLAKGLPRPACQRLAKTCLLMLAKTCLPKACQDLPAKGLKSNRRLVILSEPVVLLDYRKRFATIISS